MARLRFIPHKTPPETVDAIYEKYLAQILGNPDPISISAGGESYTLGKDFTIADVLEACEEYYEIVEPEKAAKIRELIPYLGA